MWNSFSAQTCFVHFCNKEKILKNLGIVLKISCFILKAKKKKETLNNFKQKSKLAFQKDQSSDSVDRLTVGKKPVRG